MSLMICRECGKPVSNEVPSCPSCGYPLKPPVTPGKKTNWWLLGCILAVPALMIMFFMVCIFAGIAIPAFARAREAAQMAACNNHIRTIAEAKEIWAAEHRSTGGEIIPAEDIPAILKKRGNLPFCPRDPLRSFESSYEINPVGTAPSCKHAESHHASPPRRGRPHGYPPPD